MLDSTYTVRTLRELQQAYDGIYTTRQVVGESPHYRWFLRHLKPVSGRRFLDVACGPGFCLQAVQRYQVKAYGVDLSSIAVQQAKARVPSATVLVGDGEALPWPDGFFDYIVCLGSLEHYLHPERGLQEMKRVLAPDGRLGLLLPNQYSVKVIGHLVATGTLPSEQAGFERLATMREWQSLIEASGFRVARVVPHHETKPLIDRESRKIKSVRKWVIGWFIRHLCPTQLATDFVFLCTHQVTA